MFNEDGIVGMEGYTMNVKCIECKYHGKIEVPSTETNTHTRTYYPRKDVCTHQNATITKTVYNPVYGKREVTILLDICDEQLNAKNDCKLFVSK